MKPAAFDYHRAESVEHATAMLAEFGDDAKVLGGGQSLVPMLALRLAFFDHLIDISRLDELNGISHDNGSLVIGAGTTDAAVGADERVAAAAPLLTRVTPFIGHAQIRSRGTLGGSIAHADPAAEYPAVAVALDAEMHAVSPRGERRVRAADFFTGLWETALEPDEILVGVQFPVWQGRTGFAVREFARRHGDFAIAGAVVGVLVGDDDRVGRCGIGLLGLGSTPKRGSAAEQAVLGRPVGEIDPEEVGALAVSTLDDVPADLAGSATYRVRVGATMVARAWTSAIEEALG